MKILHVISSLDTKGGGPPRALHGLSTAQVRSGLDVKVLSTYASDWDDGLKQQMTGQGVDVHMIGPVNKRLDKRVLIQEKLKSLLNDIDVLHIHAFWEEVQFIAAREAHQNGVKYIIRPCGMLDPWQLRQNPVRKKLYMMFRGKRMLARASAVHYTTEIEKEVCSVLHPQTSSIVEPNGIDLSEFRKLPELGSFRRRHSWLGDDPYVVFLGRLHYKKGVARLIKAFAEHVDEPWKLVLVGSAASDEYLEELENLVAGSNMKERIRFMGHLEGVERLEAMIDASFFVLPSHQENFGIAVIEALACGCPVLISDQVNIYREIQKAGVGDTFSLEGDKFENKLHQWTNNSSMYSASVRQDAVEFALRNYSWDEIAIRWRDNYSSVLHKR